MPCPARGTSPCPTCGQGPGEPCIIIDPLSVNYGNPTRDHAQRPTPSMAVDVLAARTVGNVTDLREYRKEKALRG